MQFFFIPQQVDMVTPSFFTKCKDNAAKYIVTLKQETKCVLL